MKILHVFADRGAENPCLSRHGEVYRFTLNAHQNEYSDVVQCDAEHLPIQPGVTFDLGIFHPPCTKWSTMPDADKDGDAPNHIPLSREIGREYCDHWIIENRPNAPLTDPVVLDGHMFELGIEYARAFETSFPVPQPPRQQQLAETSPFYYSEKPHGWWASVKGSDVAFTKEHLAKNTIPAAYLDYLIRHYYKAVETGDLPDYSEYDKEMDARRAEEQNATFADFNGE